MHKKSRVEISSKNEMPLLHMSFRPKPWYFEGDGPVCTYTFYMGEMMIPCQVSTFSEFICSAFQFQGHLAQKNP